MAITLKAARVNAGLTQTEAGAAIGVSKAVISNWESGKTMTDASQIPRIEKVYGFRYDELIFLTKKDA